MIVCSRVVVVSITILLRYVLSHSSASQYVFCFLQLEHISGDILLPAVVFVLVRAKYVYTQATPTSSPVNPLVP